MCLIPFKSCFCGKRTGRRSREILNGQTITTSSHNNDDQVQFMDIFQDIRPLSESEMWKMEFYPRDNPKSSENRLGDQRKGNRGPLALENQNDLKASHAAKHGMLQASPPIHVPVLSLKLLEQRTHNFSDKYKIGEGSYGIVYYADLNTGRPMVIKKLHISSEHASKKEFLEQVSFVSKLKHENFVELLGYCVEKNNRLLAYEHALMGSLHDVLHGKKAEKDSQPGLLLNWMQRCKIAVDAARGLEYLHKHQPPIVHGNIRSSNILLFANYKAKIADYDLSNKAPDMGACLHSISPLGSFGYQAPE